MLKTWIFCAFLAGLVVVSLVPVARGQTVPGQTMVVMKIWVCPPGTDWDNAQGCFYDSHNYYGADWNEAVATCEQYRPAWQNLLVQLPTVDPLVKSLWEVRWRCPGSQSETVIP